MNKPGIIVPLDFSDRDTAIKLVSRLSPSLCRLKIGKELFTSCGPDLVEHFIQEGYEIFLDLKFHDIPNTVAKASKAAANLGVWMVNIHASGGLEMMRAAREAIDTSPQKPLLIGVTVLTSMSAEDLKSVGIADSPEQQVVKLANAVNQAKLDGVVCSAQEASALRQAFGEAFVLVTPGIRPRGSGDDDQKRIMTPAAAIEAGSDYLVVGRPVTQAKNPLQILESITAEIDKVKGEK